MAHPGPEPGLIGEGFDAVQSPSARPPTGDAWLCCVL